MIDAALMQGWSGIGLTYAAVQVPMIAGLIRVRAQFHHYVLSPLVAAPLTAVAAVGAAVSNYGLAHLGLASRGMVQLSAATGLRTALGYAGGVGAGRDGENDRHYRRGALLADRPPAPRSKSRQHARDAGITLAGTPVPAQDETKHFKLIGTTGTGKSTAIHEIMTSALSRGDRAVIADPDGGYLRRFYRPDRGALRTHPFHPPSLNTHP